MESRRAGANQGSEDRLYLSCGGPNRFGQDCLRSPLLSGSLPQRLRRASSVIGQTGEVTDPPRARADSVAEREEGSRFSATNASAMHAPRSWPRPARTSSPRRARLATPCSAIPCPRFPPTRPVCWTSRRLSPPGLRGFPPTTSRSDLRYGFRMFAKNPRCARTRASPPAVVYLSLPAR